MARAYTSHRDGKKLAKQLKKGDRVYALWAVSPDVAPPGEDAFLYSEYTVTGQHPLLGGAMLGGAMSVERLVGTCEAVYLEPPAGYRNLADDSPALYEQSEPKQGNKIKRELRRLRQLAGV